MILHNFKFFFQNNFFHQQFSAVFSLKCFALRYLWTVWTPFSICRHFQFFLLSILIFFNIELTSISPVCIVHIESVPSTHMCSVCMQTNTHVASQHKRIRFQSFNIHRQIATQNQLVCTMFVCIWKQFVQCLSSLYRSVAKQNAHNLTNVHTGIHQHNLVRVMCGITFYTHTRSAWMCWAVYTKTQYIQRVLSVFVYLTQSQLLSFLVDFHFFCAFHIFLCWCSLFIATMCDLSTLPSSQSVCVPCLYVYSTIYTLLSGILLFLFRFGQFLKVTIDRTQLCKVDAVR